MKCGRKLLSDELHLWEDVLDLLEGEDGVDGEGFPLVPREGPTGPLPAYHSLHRTACDLSHQLL